MREKIENYLHIEVTNVDLTQVTDLEFYIRQGFRFWQYKPTVVSGSEMTVRIPFEDAMCLKGGGFAQLQFTFMRNGVPGASEIVSKLVGDLLKEAGYNP